MPRPHLLAPLALLLAASAVSAQEATPVVTKISADFGYVQAAGNSQVTTTSVGQKLTQQRGLLSFEQSFAFVYGEQQGQVNTNFLAAGIRADYKLGGHFSTFASFTYDRNRFSGIERRFEENLGLAWRAIGSESDTLRFEAGGSITQQKSTDGSVNDFPAARAAVAYRHLFSATSYFRQTVEAIPNFKDTDDFRVNTESSVVAPISARVGVKLSYVVRFDHLPEPGFQKTDRIFTTGVQITFE
jgi:putative salt-induced outer membrane protein